MAFDATPDAAFWVTAHNENKDLFLMRNTLPMNTNTAPRLSVKYSHKEKIQLAAAGDIDTIASIAGGVLRRWAKDKEKPVWEEKLEKFEPTALAACPTSKVFAVGGKNGEVRVYASVTGKVMVTLKGHEGNITAIGFSPDGKQIVTGGADKTARVWDAEKGKELAVLKGHTEAVTAVAFSPGGEMIATGSADKSAKVWEFRK